MNWTCRRERTDITRSTIMADKQPVNSIPPSAWHTVNLQEEELPGSIAEPGCYQCFLPKHGIFRPRGFRLSMSSSIWKRGQDRTWIRVNHSTAMTLYKQLPTAKNSLPQRQQQREAMECWPLVFTCCDPLHLLLSLFFFQSMYNTDGFPSGAGSKHYYRL